MHTLHNIAFEVEVHHGEPQISWEQYYTDFLRDRLLPKIERVFDAWDLKNPNMKCSIETLELNAEVDTLDLDALERSLIDQVRNQIVSLHQATNTSNDGVKVTFTKTPSTFDALIFYLKKGTLPSHTSVKIFKEWLYKTFAFSTEEKQQLRALLSVHPCAIQRMLSIVRNKYVKISQLVGLEAYITAQAFQLKEPFFNALLQKALPSIGIEFQEKQANIWYTSLQWSGSLQQFSKTLIQLISNQLSQEGKKVASSNISILSQRIIQAILRYEITQKVTIDVAEAIQIHIPKDKKSSKGKSKKNTQNKEDKHIRSQKNTESPGENSSIPENVQSVENNTENPNENNSIQKNAESVEKSTENTSKNTKDGIQDHTSDKQKKEEDSTKESKRNATDEVTKDHLASSTKKEQPKPSINQNTSIQASLLTTEKAGLIIVHPFIKSFFNEAKLLNDKGEIIDHSKALSLLHFLATGEEECIDIELSLEKVLLGIPQEEIINEIALVSEVEKQLAEELLTAVLQHWAVLKNSTVNSLRDMFIKREGTIHIEKERIQFSIEKQAQDILLDKIPWNINLIRLPWMDVLMHVEW